MNGSRAATPAATGCSLANSMPPRTSTIATNSKRCADKGLLTRLDLAFSRDQADKIYVQDRMREHGAQLWAWLEEGAHFYVCGDASRMAKDVDAALKSVVAQHGGMSDENAANTSAGWPATSAMFATCIDVPRESDILANCATAALQCPRATFRVSALP